MRYINLSTILVYCLVSKKVKKRFPNFESLMEAKLILPNEVERFNAASDKTQHETTWLPILWAQKLLTQARNSGKVKIEAPMFTQLQDSFEDIEKSNRKILSYAWVNFPLAYTQVATFSVFLYFFAALFGRQYLIPCPMNKAQHMDTETFPNLTDIAFASEGVFRNHTPDFKVPFFTLAEYFCYYGWIKVAESLLNPFGDDDENFDINLLIDRNLQVYCCIKLTNSISSFKRFLLNNYLRLYICLSIHPSVSPSHLRILSRIAKCHL